MSERIAKLWLYLASLWIKLFGWPTERPGEHEVPEENKEPECG